MRAQGYGVTESELEIGLNAVSAPVHGPDGQVIAALSASGPSYRLASELLPEVAGRVIVAAADISRRLGYRAPAG